MITWLTGYDEPAPSRQLAAESTLEDVFAGGKLNPNAALLAKGEPMEKILRV